MSLFEGASSKYQCLPSFNQILPISEHDANLLSSIAADWLSKAGLKNEILNLKKQKISINKVRNSLKSYSKTLSIPSSSTGYISPNDDGGAAFRQTTKNSVDRQIQHLKNECLILSEKINELKSQVLTISSRKVRDVPPAPVILPEPLSSSSSITPPETSNIGTTNYPIIDPEDIVQKANASTDSREKFGLFKYAADLGHTQAQNTVGYCYQNGLGTIVEPQSAFHYYSMAAETEDAGALYNLGYCYLNGFGTDADASKAYNCFKASVTKGCAAALVYLGFCYQYGQGPEKNLQNAFNCYESAAKKGVPGASARLETVRALLQSSQRGTFNPPFMRAIPQVRPLQVMPK